MPLTEWDRCQAALSKNASDDDFQLERLTDVKPSRTWDYSLPTLTESRRFTSRKTYKNHDDFFDSIKQHNEGLTVSLLTALGIFDEEPDIVLYGGSLLDIILGRETLIRDWDLRLVGPKYIDNEEACVDRAKEFVDTIFRFLTDENTKINDVNQIRKTKGVKEDTLFPKGEVQVSRCQSTITVKIPGRESNKKRLHPTYLQFTFMPYKNIQELLANCSPHCTRLAIQNNTVWLDKAAKYCIESLCLVASIESLQRCYIFPEEESQRKDHSIRQGEAIQASIDRLIKYYKKGFDIILPDLDISKIPTRNLKFDENEVLDLPYLTVVYHKVAGNKIMVERLSIPESKVGGLIGSSSRYDSTASLDINVGEMVHHNIRCLVHNVYNKFHYGAEGEAYNHIFDYVPLLTPRMIDKSYETVEESLSHGTIIIDKVVGYFKHTRPADVIEELVVMPIQKKYTNDDTSSGNRSLPEPFKFDKKKIEDIIVREKNSLEMKLKNIRGMMNTLEGNLSHLIPNFHPEINVSSREQVAEALYGSYYKDH